MITSSMVADWFGQAELRAQVRTIIGLDFRPQSPSIFINLRGINEKWV
jgi:hypothetical protein